MNFEVFFEVFFIFQMFLFILNFPHWEMNRVFFYSIYVLFFLCPIVIHMTEISTAVLAISFFLT